MVSTANKKDEQFVEEIVDELGIRPRDLVSGYSACVFVEGPNDIVFYQTVWEKLVSNGKIRDSYSDLKIGFFPFGGDNLEFFIERRLLSKLNRKFAVVVDSDRKSRSDSIPQKKAKLKKKVEREGGKFIVLKKREIENYIHPGACKRLFKEEVTIDDFMDAKRKYFDGYNGNSKFKKVVNEMTSEEILERDSYNTDGRDGHELVDIIESLTGLIL